MCTMQSHLVLAALLVSLIGSSYSHDCNQTGAVELEGGYVPYEGRVAVCTVYGTHAAVGTIHWDELDATVVCRELGFPTEGAVAHVVDEWDLEDEWRTWDCLTCDGTEEKLKDCGKLEYDFYDPPRVVGHAGVRCKAKERSFTKCKEGAVRLVGGTSMYNGTVEVCANDKWGTVCHDNWDDTDANVVCKQLGYFDWGSKAYGGSQAGAGSKRIHLDNVDCTGSEEELLSCPSRPIGKHDCNATTDAAGVDCIVPVDCKDGELRLVNRKNGYHGRVEICINKNWGTVCDDSWDDQDARVVCRQLGYASTGAKAYGDAHFGEGEGRIYLDDVDCVGTETSLLSCRHRTIGEHNCQHYEDASVKCKAPHDCEEGEIRLKNGGSPYEGRVEICIHNEWGTVCDESFGDFEASVACVASGYLWKGAKPFGGAAFGEGKGAIYLDDLECDGKELSLLDCSHSAIYTRGCSHSQDAGVMCQVQLPTHVCLPGAVRLVHGPSALEGTVEVCIDNAWGTVCDDSWDDNDAKVVCGQLGHLTTRATARSGGYFKRGSGDVHLDDVDCTGSEPGLIFCQHGGIGNHNCRHSEDAGVTCYELADCNDGDLKLVDGETNNTGTVQICKDHDWGTVCDDRWDVNDAVVVCRQLGFLTEGAIAYSNDHFGGGREPVFLDEVQCTGTEEWLLSCDSNPIGSHDCTSSENAGVFCNARCTPGEIRLVNRTEDYEGRVEYCNDLGEWGNICGYSWNETEAAVACHMLGYPRQGAVPFEGTDFGQSSREVFLIDFTCTGKEDSLDECVFEGLGSGDMMAPTDCKYVGIRCMANVTGDVCNDGDIRLVQGTCLPEGRVEICVGNTWGAVCSDYWDEDDAEVVCNELGFTWGIPKAYTGGHFGSCSRSIILDDVHCTGSETKLFSCQSNPIRKHNCQNNNEAGVSCRAPVMCDDGDVQLVPSSTSKNRNEGRVDVCHDQEWGTVCDDSWDNTDAMVVCSQLGFSRWGAEAVGNALLGKGTCAIFLDDLMCTGREENLLECTHSGIGEHNCQHSEDAGVRCLERVCAHGDIKLVDGGVDYEGRVEYCDDGAWGTICDDGWTAEDAAVVCAMLDHPRAGAVAFTGGTFGPGSGYIVLGNVACRGLEASLDWCLSGGTSGCSHSDDAGVRCIANVSNPVCNDGDVRLVDENGLTDQTEGRVEICIDNSWGTVCDDGWDAKDAAVVCSQLGFSKIGAIDRHRAYFNPGIGGIFLDDVACSGHETSLLSCPSSPIFSHNCQHSEDAGVSCLKKVCTPGAIKLVDGGVDYEGRVEYCNDGIWGTVCDDRWSVEDAAVVCAMLGHPREGAVAFVGAAFGPGTGPIILTDVECSGTEISLDRCPNSYTPSCSHSEDAGVRCIANVPNPVCDDGEVRIVDADGKTCGPNGRVEICFDNTWGTVCDSSWDSDDASVVCGQLGFSTEDAVARHNAYYNPGTGPIYLDNVRCSGTESGLLSCLSSPILSNTCAHTDDAGVSCQRVPEVTETEMCERGDVILVSGSDKSEGTVQLCDDNAWGTVCDDSWDDIDAQVVCTQLGYSAQGAKAHSNAHFGQGVGKILLDDVACTGTERDLIVCPSIKDHNCGHHEDAGVSCVEEPAGGHKEGELRLVGGTKCTEGRVEVFYNNEWGTVCDDDWDNRDAMVVCSQLGYPSQGAQAVGEAEFGEGTGKIFMDDVMCLGNESALLDCPFPGIDIHNCRHSEDAGVRCQVPDDYCTYGNLRLEGGSKEGEGRVEICIDNEWGTVCDDSWGTNEAAVACSQLGYEAEGAKAFKRATFGRGACSIFLDEISCNGTEDSLLDCTHNDVGCHNCLHSEDAGVECVVEKPCYLEVLSQEIMGDRLTVHYKAVGDVGSIQCVLDPDPNEDPDYIDCNDNPVVMRLDAGVYIVRIVALGCDPEFYVDVVFRSD